jgi:hypothetical protein
LRHAPRGPRALAFTGTTTTSQRPLRPPRRTAPRKRGGFLRRCPCRSFLASIAAWLPHTRHSCQPPSYQPLPLSASPLHPSRRTNERPTALGLQHKSMRLPDPTAPRPPPHHQLLCCRPTEHSDHRTSVLIAAITPVLDRAGTAHVLPVDLNARNAAPHASEIDLQDASDEELLRRACATCRCNLCRAEVGRSSPAAIPSVAVLLTCP